jgi:hypothetical protein
MNHNVKNLQNLLNYYLYGDAYRLVRKILNFISDRSNQNTTINSTN